MFPPTNVTDTRWFNQLGDGSAAAAARFFSDRLLVDVLILSIFLMVANRVGEEQSEGGT